MNIRKRLRTHPEVHTGALNDILFILLLFFLIVSTLANPSDQLRLDVVGLKLQGFPLVPVPSDLPLSIGI